MPEPALGNPPLHCHPEVLERDVVLVECKGGGVRQGLFVVSMNEVLDFPLCRLTLLCVFLFHFNSPFWGTPISISVQLQLGRAPLNRGVEQGSGC